MGSVHWISVVYLWLKSLQFSHSLCFDLDTHWHLSKDDLKSHTCISCRRYLSTISCHKMAWQHQGNLWGTDLKVACCSSWKLYLCVDRTIPTLPVSASLKILLLDTPTLVHPSKGLWPDPAAWLWPRLMKIPFLTALYAKHAMLGNTNEIIFLRISHSMEHWNSFPREVATPVSLTKFKKCLDNILGDMVCLLEMVLYKAGSRTQWSSWVLSSSAYSAILWFCDRQWEKVLKCSFSSCSRGPHS